MYRLVFAACAATLLIRGPGEVHAGTRARTINTGDPLPAKPVRDPACRDRKAHRWIASDPATPLAIVDSEVREAGDRCCAPWARTGARWRAVDASGQIAGEVRIAGGEGYDVTQCYELEFAATSGSLGVGLFVEASSGWRPPPPATWTPGADERKRLARLVRSLEGAMIPDPSYPCPGLERGLPLAARTLYFTRPSASGTRERWAVVGGAMLIVARLQAGGRWVATHTDTTASSICRTGTFQARAAFDMNGDGDPELVVHGDYLGSFGDHVLQADGDRWQLAATAVHSASA